MSSNPSDEALPLVVRGPTDGEITMVLANWKRELFEERVHRAWGRGLRDQDYWRLVNHILDRITLPSARIFIGAHPENEGTPMIWIAVRDGLLLFSYARRSLRKDPALVERLESAMLKLIPVVACRVHDFDPFRELERPPLCA